MDLKSYTQERGAQADLARRVRMNRVSLGNIAAGDKRPSLETLGKLFFATKGQVTADDFLAQLLQHDPVYAAECRAIDAELVDDFLASRIEEAPSLAA